MHYLSDSHRKYLTFVYKKISEISFTVLMSYRIHLTENNRSVIKPDLFRSLKLQGPT